MTSDLPEPTPTPSPRGRRMNRSRAIAAGTSVGALVALTAGVAVANPGAHSSPPTATGTGAGPSSNSNPSPDANQAPSDDGRGDDSGWLSPDDNGNVDPNSGWATPQAPSGSGSFDPGFGAAAAARAVAAAEHVVEVMGTRAHVIVVAPELEVAEILGRAAVARLHTLEAKWSRFRSDSEISALNRAGGAPVAVSAETLQLVERSIEAWHRTDGAFDPTVLPALLAAGYDRDFRHALGGPRSARCAGSGLAGTRMRRASWSAVQRVTLPVGVQLDGGGIGKGLAADTVVDLVMSAGATGACVNVGGDLRVAGSAPGADPWAVTIEHPLGGRDLGTIRLRDEALVSSWRTRRAWGADGDRRHHLIDPTTGRPAWSGLAGVTVLAPEAWWAEALATTLFLAGPDHAAAIVDHHGVSALIVRDDGAVRAFGRMCSPVTTAR